MTEQTSPVVIEKGYKSEVYLEYRKVDRGSGLVLESKLIILKGQENTNELLKMAKEHQNP